MRFVGCSFLIVILLASASLKAQEVVPGEYIVKFKRGMPLNQVQNKLMGKAQMMKGFSQGGLYHVSFKSIGGRVEDLRTDPDVEYVEPNYILRLYDENNPGIVLQTYSQEQLQDELRGQDFNMQTGGVYDQTGANIKATEAWGQSLAYSATNRPIVAVIDTGVDTSHYVFTQTSAIWSNPGEIPGNGIDDDLNGYVDDARGWNFVAGTSNPHDDQGHGTHCAGIILGATTDILKTQPLTDTAKIRLMPLKFLDSGGSGTTSNAVSAIYYAVNNGAKVINNSWGGSSYSRALHEALSYAYSRGVLVVSAAGNYSRNNDVSDMYPANYDVPSNISVAASNDSDYLASFSNYGTGLVHIASPGVLVYSTIPGGYFGLMSGTSMATPLVAGAAALAWREATQLSGFQMKGLLMSSSVAKSQLTSKVATGARLNILNMLTDTKAQYLTASSQPAYAPALKAERTVASSSAPEEQAGGGCGMIAPLDRRGPGGGAFSNISWVAIFLLLPIFLWLALRRMDPKLNRRYDRFRMQSNIQVNVGGRQLVGEMQTISVGGASFSIEEALDKGGVVSLKIASPDGKEMIEVQGHIVWNEKNHAYGVQFDQNPVTALEKIQLWTRNLVRS